jgi:hypothetical protein
VATELASLIGVDVKYLRAEDSLRDILVVRAGELPVGTRKLLEKAGLVDAVNPFAFDLIDFVERRIGQEQSRLQHRAFSPLPKSEEEWVERLEGMTVRELVEALM